RAALIGQQRSFELDFWRDTIRLQDEWRHVFPSHRNTIANGLGVALNAREANLILCFRRHGTYVVALHRWWWRSLLIGLEGNDLEWHAKDFCYFFTEFAILLRLITEAAQATPNNLLTKQLRHERAQPNDVRHCVAIPTFSQH